MTEGKLTTSVVNRQHIFYHFSPNSCSVSLLTPLLSIERNVDVTNLTERVLVFIACSFYSKNDRIK
jgi:hypothetical protein